jgi:hypothetical protein
MMANHLLSTFRRRKRMKKLMIMGAMIGFASTLFLGWLQSSPWPQLLWRSTLVCFAAGLLFRWWGGVWIQLLRQAQTERLNATSPSAQPAKL